jgi:hypothetical protein
MNAWHVFILLALICFAVDAFITQATVKLFSLGWAFVMAALLFQGYLSMKGGSP